MSVISELICFAGDLSGLEELTVTTFCRNFDALVYMQSDWGVDEVKVPRALGYAEGVLAMISWIKGVGPEPFSAEAATNDQQ